ncbi:MAG: ABC transporter substrate-binding protein [Chitinophagaceae bacterium]|nr:ABC transporter substrate-binding protein [Chitinophagaceae bacterium]
MSLFIDQTGRKVSIPQTPQRIISLVPSQTELLFDLGLDKEVTGITKFCVHPAEWFKIKTRVGGTKQIEPHIIHQLQPDLIIANKEENVKEQVEELEKHFPVWVSDVNNLDDAYHMIEQIGLITGRVKQAKEINDRTRESFSQLQTSNSKLRTAYLIWQKPYMTVGGDTFIHSMLEAAGFENTFKNKTRYPEIAIDELKTYNVELLLLSSEPYPFKQKHIDELQMHLPKTKIMLVDGEMFSWYGSHLLKAPFYFSSLHEEIKENR